MNNNRPRDKKKRAPHNEKLCFFVVQGETCCPHGEKDANFVTTWTNTVAPNYKTCMEFKVAGRCPPLFRSQVLCRYGFCCRHAASHTIETGSNIKNNIKNDEIKTTLNILDRQVLTQDTAGLTWWNMEALGKILSSMQSLMKSTHVSWETVDRFRQMLDYSTCCCLKTCHRLLARARMNRNQH